MKKILNFLTVAAILSAPSTQALSKTHVYVQNNTNQTWTVQNMAMKKMSVRGYKANKVKEKKLNKKIFIKPGENKKIFSIDRDQIAGPLYTGEQPYEAWFAELTSNENPDCKSSMVIVSERGGVQLETLKKVLFTFIDPDDPFGIETSGPSFGEALASLTILPFTPVVDAVKEHTSSIGHKISKPICADIFAEYKFKLGQLYKNLIITIDPIQQSEYLKRLNYLKATQRLSEAEKKMLTSIKTRIVQAKRKRWPIAYFLDKKHKEFIKKLDPEMAQHLGLGEVQNQLTKMQ